MSECGSPPTAVIVNGLVLWIGFGLVYAAMHVWNEKHFEFTDPWVDPFYFSATATSTVGLGDITPKTRLARLIVTVHLVGTMGFFVALACRLVAAR